VASVNPGRRPTVKESLRLFMILMLVSALSCSPRTDFSVVPPSDIASTNAVRKKLGIREIKPEWKFYGREFGEENWLYGSIGQCKKVHRKRDSDSIKWEEDYYYSGATYVSRDPDGGRGYEFLIIHYDYDDKRFYINYVGKNATIETSLRKLESTNSGRRGTTDVETLKEADKILGSWKIPRL
jgi:hypothetical protein